MRHHGISACQTNLQGSTNLSFTNFKHLASQQSKRRFPSASPFECPRLDAIALRGDEWPSRHRGAAPGCRCRRQCRDQQWSWPRSWKNRPGFYTNLWEFGFTSTFPGFKHLFKLIEIVVGCGGKRKDILWRIGSFLERVSYLWDFSMSLNFARQHEPFLHQLLTPCLAAKQKAFSNGISLRVPEVGRHCISRRRMAMTPPWSGSWLPVPISMPWTSLAVASELEEPTRILNKSVGIYRC